MSLSSTVTVTVPATTANIGPGFDCLGAALTVYNQFQFAQLRTNTEQQVDITVEGLEADRVSRDESNLAYQAFVKLYEHLGQTPPPVEINIQLGVPLARGLGSSATAIVGGLVGANAFAGSPLSAAEVMQLAIAMEGHPDNVVPALIGGCRLAATTSEGKWEICEIPWHSDIVPVVAIPNFELSTAEARRVLPSDYSRADAIFNTAHLGLLVRALETGNGKWLRAALQDRIHQPYRQTLIPGYTAVQDTAIAAGAYGLVISGAGPTLLALTSSQEAANVEAAIANTWIEQGITPLVKALKIDSTGATTKEG
ncbi:homoserine kinase [Trichocoleus sp. FACHB-262]|uniref:homoserine kinase n=1 Tax=Trichocoleus sp. FACHB-262 TaxID=2692869 RepID=UPI0016896BA5|nr:homoserine kinase [Trichocoleus sp. FACHB-262]MBD2122953.1 homoserine kinase [Trichocoleus sp. FACHB-262]